MANDSIITTNGKNTILYRAYTVNASLSGTTNLAPTQFKVGISGSAPNISNTDLNVAVPIDNGTVLNNGANIMSGSIGANNSTANTTTYKQGASQTDVTAQNLMSGSTNVLRLWSIDALSGSGSDAIISHYFGFWLYIKDATVLAKITNSSGSGSAVELRLGDDQLNYYYRDWTKAELATGWNWLHSNGGSVGGLPTIGTVSGSAEYFGLAITSGTSTDVYTTGDIIYDLLRQWDDDDLVKDFQSGYPTFDTTNIQVEQRCYLTTLQASGWNLNDLGIYNKDTSILMTGEDKFGTESKSDTDEFAYVVIDRIL